MASDTESSWHELLRCPVTLQKLTAASVELVTQLEKNRLAGTLRFQSGEPVTSPISAGLVSLDGLSFYRIEQELPVMLPEERIPLISAH